MIIKVNVISRSGQYKVKVIPESNYRYLDFYLKAGGGPLTECNLFILFAAYESR